MRGYHYTGHPEATNATDNNKSQLKSKDGIGCKYLSGNNLPQFDPWQVVPRQIFTPYDFLLISVAFVVFCRVGCLWVTGVIIETILGAIDYGYA